jgi:hypothetical protein
MSINRLFLSTTAAFLALGAFALVPASVACDVRAMAYWQQVRQSKKIPIVDKEQINMELAKAMREDFMGNKDACEHTLNR